MVTRIVTENEKNFLIVFVVASHGMNVNGQQVVVLNEFDPSQNYYKYWQIEDTITSLTILKNVYCMAFFGCGRELYIPDRASRGF